MRSIYNRGALPVQLTDSFQYLIPALRVDSYSRFIQENQPGSVSDAAGNIQPSQQSA